MTDLTTIKIKDVIKKNVIVIPAGAPVAEAAKLMARHRIGSLVVIDKSEARGILTERDIVRKVVAENEDPAMPVKDVMSTPIVVISPDVTVKEAATVMIKHKVKRLPVIDKKGFVVGIISEDDIIRLLPGLLDLLEEEANLNE